MINEKKVKKKIGYRDNFISLHLKKVTHLGTLFKHHK